MKKKSAAMTIIIAVMLLLATFTSANPLPQLMLPNVYNHQSLDGWLWSEKYDGIRGYWTGTELLSKNGNKLNAPPYFTKNFPPFPLDGELWGGSGTFEWASSVVMSSSDKGWSTIKFMVFDCPSDGNIIRRMDKIRAWRATHYSAYLIPVHHRVVVDRASLMRILNAIVADGGEGVILIDGNSSYSTGRSSNILKFKPYDDMEAIVLSYNAGKGRNTGRLGSIHVSLLDKPIEFNIGTGFSDEERANPPPIGSIVTFKYTGFTKSGKPKFPVYLRVRNPE